MITYTLNVTGSCRYLQVRWLPGGHESFAALINGSVHIVMYGYYGLAAAGIPQKYLWYERSNIIILLELRISK